MYELILLRFPCVRQGHQFSDRRIAVLDKRHRQNHRQNQGQNKERTDDADHFPQRAPVPGRIRQKDQLQIGAVDLHRFRNIVLCFPPDMPVPDFHDIPAREHILIG